MLMQHLVTGYYNLYLSIIGTDRLQKDANKSLVDILGKISTLVDTKAKSFGLAKGFDTKTPSYYDGSIRDMIARGLRKEKIPDFAVTPREIVHLDRETYKGESFPTYYITIDTLQLAYFGTDKANSDEFASFLNRIVKDDELNKIMTAIIEKESRIHETDSAIDKQINYFVQGKELQGQRLLGACEHCINLQSELDQRKFRPQFKLADDYLPGK